MLFEEIRLIRDVGIKGIDLAGDQVVDIVAAGYNVDLRK